MQWYGLLTSSSEPLSPIPFHSFDQLDKTDASPISGAYTYLPGVQCLVSFCDGIAGYAIPLCNTLAVQNPRLVAGACVLTRSIRPIDVTRIRACLPASACRQCAQCFIYA